MHTLLFLTHVPLFCLLHLLPPTHPSRPVTGIGVLTKRDGTEIVGTWRNDRFVE